MGALTFLTPQWTAHANLLTLHSELRDINNKPAENNVWPKHYIFSLRSRHWWKYSCGQVCGAEGCIASSCLCEPSQQQLTV